MSVIVGGVEVFDILDVCNFIFWVNKIGVIEVDVGDVIIYNFEIINGCIVVVEDGIVIDFLLEGIIFVEGSFSCLVIVEDGVLIFDFGEVESGVIINCSY